MGYRILSIGNFGRGWDGSICDEEHIAKALEGLGHEVKRCAREAAIIFNLSEEYDFILISQWDGYSPNLIPVLRSFDKPCPIVYWAFDYQADGQEWHERLIRQADLYLSKRLADSKYPNWQWLSQDFAPSFLRPYQYDPVESIDVLFTGSYLPWATERNETLKAVNERFNLVVHSVNDWPFLERRPPIMDEGLPELYASARVILSIDHTIETGYWSDRNAQIIACGKRPLFRYVPLSEARFRNDVDYFYSIEDCLTKIQLRLDGPDVWAVADDYRDYHVISRVVDLLTIVKGVL